MAILVVVYIPDTTSKSSSLSSPDHDENKEESTESPVDQIKLDPETDVQELDAENTDEKARLLPGNQPDTDITTATGTGTADVGQSTNISTKPDAEIKVTLENTETENTDSKVSAVDKPSEVKEENDEDGQSQNNGTASHECENHNTEVKDCLNPTDTDIQTAKASSVKFDLETADITTEEFTLAQAVHVKLEEFGIQTDIWNQTGEWNEDKDYWQVSFVLEKNQCDEILKVLTTLGIGRIQDTSISLFPANYHEGQMESDKNKSDDEAAEKKSKFMKSINSKLMVAQVVDSVKSSSQLTFDFLMFVVLASSIAAVGLAENSSVVLVASMLVSPIMGPILGGTFGLVIGHRSLCKLGVRNEVISLAICIMCGFVWGLLMAGVNSHGAYWGSTDDWPTPEMKNRGLLRGLWVGVLIALPSGAGVALSVLGGNAGSLVGVAISASLLPPAVNAGMLWAYSLVAAISPPPTTDLGMEATTVPYHVSTSTDESNLTKTVSPVMPPMPPHCASLVDNQYEFTFSCHMASEAAILGVVSLLLTIINIVCIFIMSIAVLWIKKVVPDKMVPEYARSFWKDDIKVARHAYQTLKPTIETASAGQLAREMAKEFRNQIFPDRPGENVRSSWHKMMKDIELHQHSNLLLHNLSGSNRPQLLRQISMEGDIVLNETIQEEQQKYHTITGMSQIPMTPLTPMTSDIDSPFSTLNSSAHLKRGILRSPMGAEEFLYDPNSKNRRQSRMNFQERGKLMTRMLSVPGDVKYLFPGGIPRTSSSLSSSSGRKFEITPVTEESEEISC